MTAQIRTEFQTTGTDPAAWAQHVLRGRADQLHSELGAKAELVALLLAPAARAQAHEQLLAFCTRRLVPALLAIDRTVYAAATGLGETRLLVRALRSQHDLLADCITALRQAVDPEQIAATAHLLRGLWRGYQHIEQDVLVPALTGRPEVDLPALVRDMDILLAGGMLDAPTLLDVRETPRARRHTRVFGVYYRLEPGESFLLVDDHDPAPLQREFAVAYPGQHSWECHRAGDGRWEVRIGRLSNPDGTHG